VEATLADALGDQATVSKSTVSSVCQQIKDEYEAWARRRLDGITLAGRPSGEHTQMAWQVDDIDTVVAELRRRGVVFEQVDTPGLRTANGIAEVAGNYPSAGGGGERAAWFRDSEGNLHGIGQAIP
jgi:hypothetical protein